MLERTLAGLEHASAQAEELKSLDAAQVGSTLETAQASFAARSQAAIAQVNVDYDDRAATGSGALREFVQRLTADALSFSWSSGQVPVSHSPNLRDYISVGEVDCDGEVYPALVPFSSTRGLYLCGDGRFSGQAVREVVTRLVAALPQRNLRIHVFDPLNTALLSQLAALRTLRADLFQLPTTQSRAFGSVLEGILTRVPACSELVAVSGTSSLGELWQKSPMADGALELIVVLDYPYAVDEQTNELLVRLSRSGIASGVQILVQENASHAPGRGVVPADMKALHLPIEFASGRIHIPVYDGSLHVASSSGFTDEVIVDVVERRKQAAANTQLPTVPLESLIAADIATPWTKSSLDSLKAVIGIDQNSEPLGFEFRSANPPTTNLVMGGMVGMGKTNLVLDIIYSLACAYSPDELELVLLDFKDGVEFKRFDADQNGEGWLPHVSALALESDQAFGVAVLRYVHGEYERRANLFKDVVLPNGQRGVSSIMEYRATGQKLARIVLLIDEFHRLLSGSTTQTDEAWSLLEDISRLARAFGIHVMLSSQSLSGLSAVGAKKDAIFAQYAIRLSLKNGTYESEAILATGNKVAAELQHRGELVLNANSGLDPANSNQRGLAAFVDPETFVGVQRALWEQGHGRKPHLFLGRQFLPVPMDQMRRHWERTSDDPLELCLAQPVAVTDEPLKVSFTATANQGLAFIGPDDDHHPVLPSVVDTMLISALPWLVARSVRLVVLNGWGESVRPWLAETIARLESSGLDVGVVPASEVTHALVGDIRDVLLAPDNKPTLVFGFGLQSLVGMDEKFKDGEEFSAPTYSPRSVLQDLAAKGAVRGAYFIGHWQDSAGFDTDMRPNQSCVPRFVMIKASLDSLKSLAGNLVVPVAGWPRIGFCDKSAAGRLVIGLPYVCAGSDHWDEAVAFASQEPK